MKGGAEGETRPLAEPKALRPSPQLPEFFNGIEPKADHALKIT